MIAICNFCNQPARDFWQPDSCADRKCIRCVAAELEAANEKIIDCEVRFMAENAAIVEIQAELEAARKEILELRERIKFDRKCEECCYCIRKAKYECPGTADAETCFVPKMEAREK